MTKFAMYIGIPGSGKSYIAHQHEDEYVIIDSDEVRARILGNAEDQSQNARVFDHMFKETCECLRRNVSCAYVATNISMKRRINLLSSLKEKFPDVEYNCYLVVAPLDVCYERNAARERHVPTYVISRMAKQFDPPCASEGFDHIWTIYNYAPDRDRDYYRRVYARVIEEYGEQGNSHHTLTLEEHCCECGQKALLESFDNPDIVRAAFIHDYGKAWTATRWEKDNYAEVHYPNHAEMGSYIALSMGCCLHVAQLVRFHMVPYMDEKAQNVWHQRMGEKLWKEIMLLHQYDAAAH